MNRPFLGRGWSFPPTFSPTPTGYGVLMQEEEADIASSLAILLSTRPGERVMLPEFGCNLDELVFETLDTTTKTLVADKIESAILYYEPRIDLETAVIDESQVWEGLVLITIVYRVRTTNSRFNFVFPFYKQEGTDVNRTVELSDPTVTLLPDSL